ncbi:MAG: hypothetical protein RIB78_00195 [Gammaproteobacteria bacterium]
MQETNTERLYSSLLSILVASMFLFSTSSYAATLKQVESGTASSSSNGVVTVPLTTTVDPAKAFLMFSSRHDNNTPGGSMLRGEINGAGTQVVFTRATNQTNTVNIQWYVAEFTSGVSVQRGSFTQNATVNNIGAGQGFAGVTDIDQAFVTWSKTPNTSDGDFSNDDPVYCDLTSTTNLQCRAQQANAAHTVAWQVVEFTNPGDINVQRNTIIGGAMTGGTTTLNEAITAVDVNNTMILVGYTINGGGADVGSRMLRAQLTSPTNIRIDRSVSGDTIQEIGWQAIEFFDGTTVQQGTENFTTAGGAPADMSWTHTGANRTAHSVVSVAPSGGTITAVTSGQGFVADGTTVQFNINGDSSNKLLVGISFEEPTAECGTDITVTTASYDGVNLTLVPGSQVTTDSAGFCIRTELWYLDGPSAGSDQLSIQTQGTSRAINVAAVMLNNAAAGDPESVATNSDNTGANTITTSISTLTSNAMLVDMVGNGNNGDYATNTVGQTEQQEVDGNSSIGALSTKIVATPVTSNQTIKSVAINTVDTARAIAFASVQPVGGQNMGRSDYLSDDIIGVGSFTAALSSSTQLTLERSTAVGNADVGWLVVEFNQVGLFIEVDQVTLNDTTTTPTFTAVSFLQTYPTPPLVFVLPTNENTDPAAIRIRNVTTTGFEMAQVEPEPQDGRSVPMTVDYIAMTEGVFTLPDGRTIEAGTHTTQTVQHGSGVPGGEGWDTVNYTSTFTNPSVLLQIQGFANEYNNPPTTTSRPWLTASIQNVGNTSFETALERSEVNDGNPATINTDETIAYLAIDGNVQGSFTAQGTTILYETIVSADNIQGWDNENCAGGAGQTVPFVNTYSATPLAIGHTRRHDGGDGGLIRRCSIDATQIGLAYEEDIFRDGERNHTTEQASVLVFSEAFCYPTCVGNVIDHYDIDFSSGSGITCLPVDVTITAKDSSNATVNHTSATTIDFVTSTGRGTWSSTPSAGTGTVTPGTPGNGDASYEFPAGEASVTIPLNYPDLAGANSETFSINITSAITETSGTAPGDTDPGDGTDDPTIDFFLTGIIYNNVTDGNNTIPTQISGKPSNTGFNSKTLNLQVVRATDDDPSVCTSIFGPGDVVGIELGAECKNPSTCAGRELNISNAATPSQYIDTSDDDGDSDNAASVASYELVNLEFGVNAAAEIVLNYPDAGQLELHARYELLLDDGTPSGEYATGISNNFIVRPFGFTVTDINAGVANPGGVTSTGGIFTTAGSGFSANVGAYLWQAADDDGVPFGTADDGIPDFQIVSGVLIEGVDITDNNDLGFGALAPNFAWDGALFPFLYLPTGGATGTLNNGTFVQGDFTNGQVPLPDLEYTEVGSMSLVLTINGYLGDGTLNFFGLSAFNGQSGETVLGSSNYGAVGRFIPWRFDVSANTPDFADSCTGFTYQEQTFYYNTAPELTLTAYAETGNTTLNYGGGNTAPNGFVKFTSSPALARGYADGHAAPPPPNASLSSLVGGSIALGGETDFDGVITLTLASGAGGDAFMYQKDIAEAPFNADVDVSFLAAGLTDSDGVCYDSAVSPGRCNSAIAPVDTADGYAITDIGNTELRFGRLNIGTAAGSELLPVTVPFQTEYFDGTNFIVNALDGCTSIGATDLSLDSAVQTAEIDGTIDISDATGCGNGLATATVTNDPFAAGIGELVFTLASPAAGCTGYIDISPQSLSPWLQYDWDDTDNNEDGPYDDDPHGRAEFGIFEGPAEYIYIREPW